MSLRRVYDTLSKSPPILQSSNGHLFLAVAVAVGWVGSGGAVCIPLRGGISR